MAWGPTASTNVVLGLVGLGLSALSFGFIFWGTRLDKTTERVTKSMDDMAKSVREVVDVRLSSMSHDVHDIKQAVKELVADFHEVKKETAVAIAELRLKEKVRRE